jgi:hypothetical protein
MEVWTAYMQGGLLCVPGNSVRTLKLKSCKFVHSTLSGLTDGQIKPVSRTGMKGFRQVTAYILPICLFVFWNPIDIYGCRTE